MIDNMSKTLHILDHTAWMHPCMHACWHAIHVCIQTDRHTYSGYNMIYCTYKGNYVYTIIDMIDKTITITIKYTYGHRIEYIYSKFILHKKFPTLTQPGQRCLGRRLCAAWGNAHPGWVRDQNLHFNPIFWGKRWTPYFFPQSLGFIMSISTWNHPQLIMSIATKHFSEI